MTKQEILKKAIAKAVKNGYKDLTEHTVAPSLDKEWKEKYLIKSGHYMQIIFDLKFAKNFWAGEKCTCVPDYDEEMNCYHKPNCKMTTPDWRCHLQTMVREENPIKYLEQFIK